MTIKKSLYAIAIGGLLFSCTPKQNINYMENIETLALENSIKNSRVNLQPGDRLIITVSAQDMDVVAPFNQTYSSTSAVVQYTVPSSNNTLRPEPASGPTYIVDTDSNIIFPQIGSVSVKDENVESFRVKLTDLISKYVKNPVIDVKLVNFKVSVIGEVSRPGQYTIPDGSTTLLGALGMAGDLTPYGVRNNILVLRTVDGQITQQRININNADFINSPFYYLKQNDVVYVQPNANREKASRIDPNTGLYISVASVLASLTIGILALINRN